jgi:cephalosporin-C deacetylase
VDKLPYAYAGYAVLAMDVRGQMGMSDDNLIVSGNTMGGHIIRGLARFEPKNLFFKNVYLDTAATARILMNMDIVDENRVGAMGGSQGGALTLACAALEPRVKMNASMYPFLSDFKRTWEMDLFKDAYDELAKFIRHLDPRHQRIDEMFETLGYIDIANLTPRIKGESYMFITLQDRICPPSTQFAAYNKIEAKKACEIYPNHGHEALLHSAELIFEFFKKL